MNDYSSATSEQARVIELGKLARLLLNDLRDAIDSDANDAQLVQLIVDSYESAYAIEVQYEGRATMRVHSDRDCG